MLKNENSTTKLHIRQASKNIIKTLVVHPIDLRVRINLAKNSWKPYKWYDLTNKKGNGDKIISG